MRTNRKLGKWYSSPKGGFPGIEFRDGYKKLCSVEMSSLASNPEPGTTALWLGVNGHRMHLMREQVEALQWVLETWLCEGGFKKEHK
jgi:hypothetical protein